MRTLRHAVRLLTHTPAFTLPVIASLSLGLAVNTTMFSVVNAVLLKPLVDSRSETIVRIGRSMNSDGGFRSLSHDEFEFLRRHASSFSDLIAHQISTVSLTLSERPHFVSAEIVTPNYFRPLHQLPAVGRDFDQHAADEDAIVISDRFWRQRFDSDPAVIGREVAINNRPFTIVGIAPRGFFGTFPGVSTDVWLPAIRRTDANRADPRAQESMSVTGVLKRDVSITTVRSELQALSERIAELNPQHDRRRGFTIAAARGIHPGLARVVGPFSLALMAVVSVVLLIVCANVASLLLARARARQSEFAVRMALGASRRRVIDQLLIESAVLAVMGAAGGLLLSFWALRVVNALTTIPGPTGAPIYLDLRIDQRVLLFTAVVTTVTTFAFSLLPALQGTRTDLVSGLKQMRSEPRRHRSRLRDGLVMVQVMVSVVLLVGAVLLFRSVSNSTRIDLGFEPDHVAVASFNLEPAGYDPTRAEQFYLELLRRVRALPSVGHAALADFVPMGGRGGTVTVTRSDETAPSNEISAPYNRVSDDYFTTLGHQLIRGRDSSRRIAPVRHWWPSSTRGWPRFSGRTTIQSASAYASSPKPGILAPNAKSSE